ncbi:MAG: zf-HC2 domain-containing protein [Acidobacteria bacterium]|nr:zf-HC2 domain-containing protein [Acidobacteriota bacterium]
MDMCNGKELLIAYVYDDCTDAERGRAEAHLGGCAECRQELEALRAARDHLAAWAPPDRALGFKIVQEASAVDERARRRIVPAWGLAAAAVLVLAAASAVANLEVRYEADGFIIRTGWSRPAAMLPAAPQPARADAATWRAELAALERKIRHEFEAGSAAARPAGTPAPASGDAASSGELLRRVRALIEDSETRQQREMALRFTELVRDFDRQRQLDLTRIQQGFGRLEGATAEEVAQHRELLNYLVRVSQNPQR